LGSAGFLVDVGTSTAGVWPAGYVHREWERGEPEPRARRDVLRGWGRWRGDVGPGGPGCEVGAVDRTACGPVGFGACRGAAARVVVEDRSTASPRGRHSL